jgi:hypothetical protein
VLDNTFSGTPLEYLEPLFIILFSFLAIYILVVIISMGFRLKKFLKNKKCPTGNVKKDNNKKVQNYNEIKNISKKSLGKEINKISAKESFKSLFERFSRDTKKQITIFNEKFIKTSLLKIKKYLLAIKDFFKQLKLKIKFYFNKFYKLIKAKVPIVRSAIAKKFKALVKSLKDFIDNKHKLD